VKAPDRTATQNTPPAKRSLSDNRFLAALLILQTFVFVVWVLYVTQARGGALRFVNEAVQERWLLVGVSLVQWFMCGAILLFSMLSRRKRFAIVAISLLELLISVYAGVSS
jgi:hypothetical protein